eukprot:6482966-Amphidinium_carterae.1
MRRSHEWYGENSTLDLFGLDCSMTRHLVEADLHPNDVHKTVTGKILCALVAWLVRSETYPAAVHTTTLRGWRLNDFRHTASGVWATMALAFILPCAFHMDQASKRACAQGVGASY